MAHDEFKKKLFIELIAAQLARSLPHGPNYLPGNPDDQERIVKNAIDITKKAIAVYDRDLRDY